jgi:hypothetical protein
MTCQLSRHLPVCVVLRTYIVLLNGSSTDAAASTSLDRLQDLPWAIKYQSLEDRASSALEPVTQEAVGRTSQVCPTVHPTSEMLAYM